MMNAALNIKDYGYTSGMPGSGVPEQWVTFIKNPPLPYVVSSLPR